MPITAAAPDYSRRAVTPPDLIWKLDVDQYHDMIETGILTDDDPVELLDGCLVPKMPKNPPHTLSKGLISDAISALLPEDWFADSQEPITTEDSEPEPDVRVVRGGRRDYLERHPGGKDVGLVVEVSAATLERDRSLKQRLYARSGVPVYWIVNLRDRQIEVYTEPSGPADEPGYGRRRDLQDNDQVVLVLDGVEVGRLAVRDVLP